MVVGRTEDERKRGKEGEQKGIEMRKKGGREKRKKSLPVFPT